ncbi:hypothetical protein D3C84_983440 [compost metagenome]
MATEQRRTSGRAAALCRPARAARPNGRTMSRQAARRFEWSGRRNPPSAAVDSAFCEDCPSYTASTAASNLAHSY